MHWSDDALSYYLDRMHEFLEGIARLSPKNMVIATGMVVTPEIARRFAARRRIPFVVLANDNELDPVALAFVDRLAGEALDAAHCVVVTNRDADIRVRAALPELSSRTVLLPPGVNVDAFRIGSARAPHEPVILFSGRLTLDCGLDRLFAALPLIRRQIPDVRVRIVGDGPAKATFLEMLSLLDGGDIVGFAHSFHTAAECASVTANGGKPLAEAVMAFAHREPSGYFNAAQGLSESIRWESACDPRQLAELLQDARVTVMPGHLSCVQPQMVLQALACGVRPIVTEDTGVADILEQVENAIPSLKGHLELRGPLEKLVSTLAERCVDHLALELPIPLQMACHRYVEACHAWDRVVSRLLNYCLGSFANRRPTLSKPAFPPVRTRVQPPREWMDH